ncbi:hypothetical protein D9O50_06150 [Oxalobacteraceae bacterium CAVE-383]|nr:hypothetical protein D9O50_06150 [Oxalobacteraceae bacterium CAVE-383]
MAHHHSMPKELIIQAAALRHIQDYVGALNLIEANIESFDGADRVQGRLQGFYAAREGGLLEKARTLALQIAEEDPGIPSVRAFLSEGPDRAG